MAEASSSLKGQLLLDSGLLQGSFFHRTVVLICHHDSEGAFGLVLNRPADKKVGEVLTQEMPESLDSEPLYLGGPVQTTALSYLHSDAYLPEGNVMANLRLDHSVETLLEVSQGYSPARRLKVFAGYAGWAAGQLEEEMERRAWIRHPAELDLVFERTEEELWARILRQKGWKYKLLSESPPDLSWN